LLADVGDQLDFFAVEQVPTVYIGGGTPSVLGARRMERLLAGLGALLRRNHRRAPDEFTVEANPESADDDFLRALRDGGVSRISLGVQSFHEPSRRAVHRLGAGGALLDKRLALAGRRFPNAVSADLITGLPFQTESVLREDIERLLAFGPAHVSLYSLTLESGTPLERNIQAGGGSARFLPDLDRADSLWLAGRGILEAAGFEQYEVSNFARPGKRCAHNVRYWRMENWLGAGPAASGTIIDDRAGIGRRYTFPADIRAYLGAARPAVEKAALVEDLDGAALIKECLLMGFRYREGPDPKRFHRRFSRAIEECIPRTVARWKDRGFFTTDFPSRLAPSPRGLLFLDGFLRDAFEELE
jgi:oxygen-independent coproporphyrinogen-3 oxidase